MKNLKKPTIFYSIANVNHKNIDFIIVESYNRSDEVPESWTWLEGRLYCAIQLKSDYYPINSAIKQMEVESLAKENNITSKGWLGLFEESEGSWKWPDGSPTNNYFNWKDLPSADTKLWGATIRFDVRGTNFGKWTSSRQTRALDILVCSRRTLLNTPLQTFYLLLHNTAISTCDEDTIIPTIR